MPFLRYGVLEVDLPEQWEGRAFTRPAEVLGEQTHTVLHLANFALPARVEDFGGGAVERMRSSDVFISVLEFGRESLGTDLFAAGGMPTVTRESFDRNLLQRGIAGQSGAQMFFTTGGRPYCLYVVLGAHAMRLRLVPEINRVLQRVTLLE